MLEILSIIILVIFFILISFLSFGLAPIVVFILYMDIDIRHENCTIDDRIYNLTTKECVKVEKPSSKDVIGVIKGLKD